MRVSDLIYRTQVACGISAKVILVTLEKEQSLVTGRAPTERNFTFAMGANCPDTAPCDPAYSGIGPQILAGVTSLKNYSAGRFSRQPGVHWIGFSPREGCGGTNVNVTNYATAALYNYTPYQPNASSLAAGYGTGDVCGSYGNRNFYNFFTDWFGPTTGQGRSPLGVIQEMSTNEDGILLRGWALDVDDVTAALQIRITVAGATTVWTADQVYEPVAAANPGAGARHAFSGMVAAPPGTTQRICVDAINIGLGKDTSLGCREISLPPRVSPRGEWKDVWASVDGIHMWGWSIDPDNVPNAVDLHIQVDQTWFVWKASAPYALGPTLIAGAGTNHGWGGVLPAAPGDHRVCVTMINQKQGTNTAFGCKDVYVPSIADVSPKGQVKEVSVVGQQVGLWGWVVDPDARTQPVSVIVQLDSNWYEWRADQPNPTAESLYPGSGPNHGWGGRVDASPGVHWLCVYFRNLAAGADVNAGCQQVTVPQPVVVDQSPKSRMMGAWAVPGGIELWGYAVDPDSVATRTTVVVQAGNTWLALTADAAYPPGAEVHPGADGYHGYHAIVPMPPGRHWVCAYAINAGAGADTAPQCAVVDVR